MEIKGKIMDKEANLNRKYMEFIKLLTIYVNHLGIAYRVLSLATGDLSFAAAKCYDLEAWAPGSKKWLEVSSCSNFVDFQARRAGLKYKSADMKKPAFLHTLNGSGVALPRLVMCLMENGQQSDGSIVLPDALRPYLM